MHLVRTFYKFFPIPEKKLMGFQSEIMGLGQGLDILGLFLIGTEGVNATISGKPEGVDRFQSALVDILNCGSFTLKDTTSEKSGFHCLKVKIRKEIVTLGRTDIFPSPDKSQESHLSPNEWDQKLAKDDVIVLDTRNTYEINIGRFKGAKDLKIRDFHEFPDKLSQSHLAKDKEYLIYCTGGIRCEKAVFAMKEQGYQNVYQLDGGIINYLKEKPNQNFEGECFVFDYRVALNQELKPSENYRLCPHCGDPGNSTIQCVHCGKDQVVCQNCLSKGSLYQTCSKNCSHHHSMGHQFKRPTFRLKKATRELS